MNDTLSPQPSLTHHYAPGNLLQVLQHALAAIGKTGDSASADDFAPMEEFHVGGREASRHLFEPLNFSEQDEVLDVGCGLGGPARFLASHYGCKVRGIDLTAEFIETGKVINQWLGLDQRVRLQQGDVMALPVENARFDAACMLHVGMNIPDKPALFKEVARVLKPGASFAIYDLMRIGAGEIGFPVPWSAGPGTSFVASEADYREALENAGFRIIHCCNRHDFALRFYAEMQEKIEASGGPGPIGLHLLMGSDADRRLKNAYAAITAGTLAPVELIARKAQ